MQSHVGVPASSAELVSHTSGASEASRYHELGVLDRFRGVHRPRVVCCSAPNYVNNSDNNENNKSNTSNISSSSINNSIITNSNMKGSICELQRSCAYCTTRRIVAYSIRTDAVLTSVARRYSDDFHRQQRLQPWRQTELQ